MRGGAGRGGAGDVAAQLFQRLAVVGAAAHSGMQAEPVSVGAHALLEVRSPGHHALHRQHLLPSARTGGDAVGSGRRMQRPERARFVRVTAVVGHVTRTFLFDQQPPTGEQLHRAGDDLVRHRLERCIVWHRHFHENRQTVGTAPVHAVQHPAVKVDGRRCISRQPRPRLAGTCGLRRSTYATRRCTGSLWLGAATRAKSARAHDPLPSTPSRSARCRCRPPNEASMRQALTAGTVGGSLARTFGLGSGFRSHPVGCPSKSTRPHGGPA